MQTRKNVLLKDFTSLGCGGPAESLVIVENSKDLEAALRELGGTQVTVLGYGTNALISDNGIPGTVILTQGGDIIAEGDLLIADAGVWWDTLVQHSLEKGLWGLELTSGVPSSIGGAVVGNIAAYGQQVSDTLEWIDVFDPNTNAVERINASKLKFDYRECSLQQQPELIILRAAFKLTDKLTTKLTYASATDIAEEMNLKVDNLQDRRTTILEARRRGGSLYDPNDPNAQHTAGSFFKNPLVSAVQAESIANHDETGKSLKLLLEQNKVHGGNTRRSSAAHVLLAAGFQRGQTWGAVRLHPNHILKIENTGGATAQEIYNVAHLIMNRVKEVLGITLVPEVRFIGHFDEVQ